MYKTGMQKRKPKGPGGRPRVIARPYRLNLYVEAAFAAELKALAAHLGASRGESVSIGRAITEAVRRSPQFQAMQRAKR